MTDAHQALRQHVHEEAADKLLTGELHDFGLVVPVVGVAKVHVPFFDADDALVADGDTVAIARQVADDALYVVQARLAVDIPRFLHELIEHGFDLIRAGDAVQLTCVCAFAQRADHSAPEVA